MASTTPANDNSCSRYNFYYHNSTDGRDIDFEVALENPVRLSDLLKDQSKDTIVYRDLTKDLLLDCNCSTGRNAIYLGARKIVGLPKTTLSAPYMGLETAKGCFILGELFYDELGNQNGGELSFTAVAGSHSGKGSTSQGVQYCSSEWKAAMAQAGQKAGIVFEMALKPKSS